MNKTIATLGIWAAIGVIGYVEPIMTIITIIPALFATAVIWES